MKRRPPQSALARNTDGGSGRLEVGSNSTLPHAGQAGGSFEGGPGALAPLTPAEHSARIGGHLV